MRDRGARAPLRDTDNSKGRGAPTLGEGRFNGERGDDDDKDDDDLGFKAHRLHGHMARLHWEKSDRHLKGEMGASPGRRAPPRGDGRLYRDRGVYMRKGTPPGERGASTESLAPIPRRGAPLLEKERLHMQRRASQWREGLLDVEGRLYVEKGASTGRETPQRGDGRLQGERGASMERGRLYGERVSDMRKEAPPRGEGCLCG